MANPVEDLDRPQRPHRVLQVPSVDEADRLLAACGSSQERLIIALLRYCGLRRSELLGLGVSDIAADYSSLRIDGKGRKERIVPVHDSVKPLLAAHVASLESGEEALIRNRAGKPMSATTLTRLFRRLVRRSGLDGKDVTPHKLRHHFASQLVRAGVDVATVAELLGHSNISTTSIYLHSDPAARRAAVNRLPAMSDPPAAAS